MGATWRHHHPTLPRLKLSRGESVTSMTYAAANWQRFTDPFDADWSTPVRKVVQDLPKDTHAPQVVYSRYAAFTVVVKLADRQRTYLALFLFGRNPDGTEAVFPVDHVLGMGSLKFFMENSIYPQPLLETHLREWPGVRDWIASAAVSSVSANPDGCGVSVSAAYRPRSWKTHSLRLSILRVGDSFRSRLPQEARRPHRT